MIYSNWNLEFFYLEFKKSYGKLYHNVTLYRSFFSRIC